MDIDALVWLCFPFLVTSFHRLIDRGFGIFVADASGQASKENITKIKFSVVTIDRRLQEFIVRM